MQPPRSTGRSILAGLSGFLAVVLLSLGTDQLFHWTGVFPSWGETMSEALFFLATAYRLVYGILGSYIAARLAPNRPMFHALALGVVGLIASTAGAAATWNAGPAFGPKWYPLTLVASALPCAWIGGKLWKNS